MTVSTQNQSRVFANAVVFPAVVFPNPWPAKNLRVLSESTKGPLVSLRRPYPCHDCWKICSIGDSRGVEKRLELHWFECMVLSWSVLQGQGHQCWTTHLLLKIQSGHRWSWMAIDGHRWLYLGKDGYSHSWTPEFGPELLWFWHKRPDYRLQDAQSFGIKTAKLGLGLPEIPLSLGHSQLRLWRSAGGADSMHGRCLPQREESIQNEGLDLPNRQWFAGRQRICQAKVVCNADSLCGSRTMPLICVSRCFGSFSRNWFVSPCTGNPLGETAELLNNEMMRIPMPRQG